MLLDDPRLNFASELILHWTRMRGSGLVPPAEYIDPEEMIGSVPFITIAEICHVETAKIQLAEAGLERRFGQDRGTPIGSNSSMPRTEGRRSKQGGRSQR